MEKYLAPQAEVAENRAKYRSGRKERAVKVYTVNQESKYLIILNIPIVGAQKELLQQLSIYGNIIQWRMLDEYPHEEYTEVMWVEFEHIDNARHARKKMDDTSFFGLQLRIVYAPEYETPNDTWAKLRDRRNTIGAKLAEIVRGAQPNRSPHQQPRTSQQQHLNQRLQGKRTWDTPDQHQHMRADPLSVHHQYQQQQKQQPYSATSYSIPATGGNALQFTPRVLQPHSTTALLPSPSAQTPAPAARLPQAPPPAASDPAQQTILAVRNKLARVDKPTDPLAKRIAKPPP